jgi:hypothetical protein
MKDTSHPVSTAAVVAGLGMPVAGFAAHSCTHPCVPSNHTAAYVAFSTACSVHWPSKRHSVQRTMHSNHRQPSAQLPVVYSWRHLLRRGPSSWSHRCQVGSPPIQLVAHVCSSLRLQPLPRLRQLLLTCHHQRRFVWSPRLLAPHRCCPECLLGAPQGSLRSTAAPQRFVGAKTDDCRQSAQPFRAAACSLAAVRSSMAGAWYKPGTIDRHQCCTSAYAAARLLRMSLLPSQVRKQHHPLQSRQSPCCICGSRMMLVERAVGQPAVEGSARNPTAAIELQVAGCCVMLCPNRAAKPPSRARGLVGQPTCARGNRLIVCH